MTKNAKHLKTTAEHNTPRAIVEAARTVLGTITLDPMSNAAAQRVIRATTYWTAADDCFAAGRVWAGTVFLNPAGGLVKQAWQKLMAHYGAGDIPAFVFVGFSLEQLQTLQRDINPRELYHGPSPIEFPICIPHARLAFEDQDGVPQDSPTHANYITYGGPEIARFLRVFSAFGTCRVPMFFTDDTPVRDDPSPYEGIPG